MLDIRFAFFKMAKINQKQKDKFCEFMEMNYKYIFSRDTHIEAKKKKWNELADSLNKLGPPQKKTEKWEKVILFK